jgi:hypothetical protein
VSIVTHMSKDAQRRADELEAWRKKYEQGKRLPEGKIAIAVNGPCRLTKEERRQGESREFRNKRLKSRNRNKMAKASRKNR